MFWVFFTFASFVDPEGWAHLERPPKNVAFEKASEEDNPSLWVLFSKEFEGETFFVWMPQDPSYTYPAEGELEVRSFSEKGVHRLHVFPRFVERLVHRGVELSLDPEVDNLLSEEISAQEILFSYRKGGKWIFESWKVGEKHLFFYQTQADQEDSSDHEKFSSPSIS